jgi:pimeloyl-ACP methyl ester carboxylesterase
MVSSPPASFVERDARLTLADGTPLVYSVATAHAPAQRPPILLLHGLASNRTRWAEFAETTTLTRHFDVLRVDLRGHGESVTRANLTLQRWCNDLVALLDARGDARAILIGHSLGAQVALAFAARHPERCAALALIDPIFRDALRGKWWLIAALGPLFAFLALLVRAANRAGLQRRVVIPYDLKALDVLARQALGSKQAEEDFVRQYSSTLADLRHFRSANYLQDLVEMVRPTPPLASLRQPVLTLLSSGGTFADPADMALRLAVLPRGQIGRIECQHWPLTEKPGDVRVAIERWCESLG